MRPFFTFYGGKFRQAARLPAPEYPVIVEPFAGSLGYSVRYGANRQVVAVDRDPTIAGLWRWLIGAHPDEVRSLPLVGADDDLRDFTHLDDGARSLIGFWLNKGVTAPCNRPSKWMREHDPRGSANFWGPVVRERVASQVDLIRSWSIIEGDYTDAPDIEATWLIDPPYTKAGRHYRFGSLGIDYGYLAEWCRTRRGQVIVCEQVGADWLPFEPVPYPVKAARNGGRGFSREAIWIDGGVAA